MYLKDILIFLKRINLNKYYEEEVRFVQLINEKSQADIYPLKLL